MKSLCRILICCLLTLSAGCAFLDTDMISYGQKADGFDEGVVAFNTSDYQAALRMLQAPAENGNVDAQYLLGLIYINGLADGRRNSYMAEKWFGIADITGAYCAGILLSNLKETSYIDRKVDINSYMIFSPVFFANIGISASFAGFNVNMFLFGLCFVAAGILGKIIGCGSIARCLKFNTRDSMKIGVGMIARGEVALVVCKKGLEAGIFEGTSIDPLIDQRVHAGPGQPLCFPQLLIDIFQAADLGPLSLACLHTFLCQCPYFFPASCFTGSRKLI